MFIVFIIVSSFSFENESVVKKCCFLFLMQLKFRHSFAMEHWHFYKKKMHTVGYSFFQFLLNYLNDLFTVILYFLFNAADFTLFFDRD